MSDDTGEVRIFGSDPERVVSVTVGELQRLYSKSWLCGAHDDIDTDPIIHERTCHPKGDWKPVSQTQKVRRRVCDCGHELGMDRKVTAPFTFAEMCELPDYCPNCGARVVYE